MSSLSRALTVGATLLGLAVVTAACSGDADDPGPAGSGPGPSSTSTGVSTGTGTPAAAPAEVVFGTSESVGSLACPLRYTEYVAYEQVSTDGDIVLDEVTPGAGSRGVTLGQAWVSTNADQLLRAGLAARTAPGVRVQDEPGWPEKEPLDGAALAAGSEATVFVEVSLDPGAHFDGLQLGYHDLEGTTGAAAWESTLDVCASLCRGTRTTTPG